MDLALSAEQAQFRDAVARWARKNIDAPGRGETGNLATFTRSTYRELALLGLSALYVGEKYEGLGMGAVDVMIAMEELGRVRLGTPVRAILAASKLIGRYGDETTKTQWLPRVAAGEVMLSLAVQERTSRYRVDHCQAQAIYEKGRYSISGSKDIVPLGNEADALIVPALLASAPALFIVERQGAGVRTRSYRTHDGSDAADIRFERSPATLLTRDGAQALQYGVDACIACICAEAVGSMEEMLALTIAYMKTRKQFGVAIAEFQALRHRVSGMKMALELARGMSYYASVQLDADRDDRSLAMSRAKIQAGDAMRRVGQEAVQLHGGIGVADEHVVSHHFRYLTQLELSFGDTFYHLGLISDALEVDAGVSVLL